MRAVPPHPLTSSAKRAFSSLSVEFWREISTCRCLRTLASGITFSVKKMPSFTVPFTPRRSSIRLCLSLQDEDELFASAEGPWYGCRGDRSALIALFCVGVKRLLQLVRVELTTEPAISSAS